MLISIFASFYQVDCQINEVSIKLLALSKSRYNENPIQGSVSTYSEKNTPALNLIAGYTFKFIKKTEATASFGVYKNKFSSRLESPSLNEISNLTSWWLHSSISIGRRSISNKFLFLSNVGIPFELIFDKKSSSNRKQFDTSNKLIAINEYQHQFAPIYSTGIFLNQGIYYNLISNFYIGFDLRIGLGIDINAGIDKQFQNSTYNGTTTISESEINIKYTSLSLPLMSNIGIRYIFNTSNYD